MWLLLMHHQVSGTRASQYGGDIGQVCCCGAERICNDRPQVRRQHSCAVEKVCQRSYRLQQRTWNGKAHSCTALAELQLECSDQGLVLSFVRS